MFVTIVVLPVTLILIVLSCSPHVCCLYWCFYVKLLQINYNNQRVAMELVTCQDLCKRVSHVLGFVQSISHKLEVCASKERRLLQDQVQLGIGAKVQLQVAISGQAWVVGKIPYTCNCLIVDQQILGSGDLKITQQGFCLAWFALFVNKLSCQIYFPLHLVFLVICWCLHDLHAIEPN